VNEVKYAGFIRLEHDLVRSEVWAALSANATRLLIGIWDQYNGHNNGFLPYGTEQAMRLLRCSTSTAKRTFAELKDAGLIIAVKKGAFARKDQARKGEVTEWQITALKSNVNRSTSRSSLKSLNGTSNGV
jgi:hypothetical protein